MTRRTRRLLLFGLPAGLVAAMLAVWLLWPRTAITRENADKIRMGMTLAEVETILGGRARNEATGTLSFTRSMRLSGLACVYACSGAGS
jgi:hypothetical protein